MPAVFFKHAQTACWWNCTFYYDFEDAASPRSHVSRNAWKEWCVGPEYPDPGDQVRRTVMPLVAVVNYSIALGSRHDGERGRTLCCLPSSVQLGTKEPAHLPHRRYGGAAGARTIMPGVVFSPAVAVALPFYSTSLCHLFASCLCDRRGQMDSSPGYSPGVSRGVSTVLRGLSLFSWQERVAFTAQ